MTTFPLGHPLQTAQALLIFFQMHLLLPDDEILDLTKLKAFADDKLSAAVMLIDAFDRVENIAGKGENADYQHFLHLPQCFQKLPFAGSLEVGIMS